MSLPAFQKFLRPVLEVIAEHSPMDSARQKIPVIIASKMRFSDEEKAEILPSGGSRLRSRCGWALTYLTKAGLLEYQSRGRVAVTSKGGEYLKDNQGDITVADLNKFETFRDFSQVESGVSPNVENANAAEIATTQHDPETRVELAMKEIKARTVTELLELLSQVDPRFFERVILDLMIAMGYGSNTGGMEHTGRSGDFGIDGIIHMDKLRLDKIYLQAKRWQGPIGRPDVQGFYGALAGKRAMKGVIMTTSYFTQEAKDFADTVSNSLILVDGKALAGLMIDHSVGVSKRKIFALAEIDHDYFDE
jgi:restriction system protein